MALSWEKVAAREQAQFGVSYRTTLYLRQGYIRALAAVAVNAIKLALNAIPKKSYTVQSVEAIPPRDPRLGKGWPSKVWALRIHWTKTGPGTPVAAIVAIIVLVVVATGSFVILAKVTEKQFENLGEGISRITKDILSPGMVLAVIIVVALVWGAKGGTS